MHLKVLSNSKCATTTRRYENCLKSTSFCVFNLCLTLLFCEFCAVSKLPILELMNECPFRGLWAGTKVETFGVWYLTNDDFERILNWMVANSLKTGCVCNNVCLSLSWSSQTCVSSITEIEAQTCAHAVFLNSLKSEEKKYFRSSLSSHSNVFFSRK